MAQTTDLEKLWKSIDEQSMQGELKSLQPKIEQAISLAKKEKKYPFVVKGLFYNAKIKVSTSDEKDDVNFIFKDFEKEISQAKGVELAIYKTYLAKLYQIYFNENRWKIQGRTNLENQNSTDVRYWTENAFYDKINSVYQEVIAQKSLLEKESSKDWKDLIIVNENLKSVELERTFEITPTVYDLVAQDYIGFIKEKDQNKAYDELEKLSKVNLANQKIAAFLYNQEQLINLNKNDVSEDEVLKSLENLALKYQTNWYSAEIYKHIASVLYNRYQEDNSVKSEDYKKVLDLVKLVNDKFPNTESAKAMNTFRDAILSSDFSVEIEQYIVPNQNTPFKISHRNLNKVYVRILDYNIGVKDLLGYELQSILNNNYKDSETKYNQFIKQHSVVDEYVIDLKSFDDYVNHSSLFNFKPIKAGRYVVLLSSDPSFKFSTKKELNYVEVNATEFAPIYTNKTEVSLKNRTNGKPIANKKVEFYQEKYDSKNRVYQYSLIDTKVSDKNGNIPFTTQNNFLYRIADENVFYKNNGYRYDNYNNEVEVESVKIFTDRAIYRPGQPVYFKGILTSTHQKEIKVIPNEIVEVSFHDVNGKEIFTQEFTTNEFGSFHGEYILPSSVLTGNFTIETDYDGYYNFSVEEYKRPKFQVEIEQPTNVYKLDDEVKVEGKAVAFSGVNIDQAKVEYRVYRQAIYPYRPWGSYKRIAYEKEEQVAFGSTETDKDGKFTFNFKALAARNQKNKEDIRTYVYRIETSVTDLNGETQSGNGSVKVGDRTVLLSTNLPTTINVKSLDKIEVNVTNLNEQKIKRKGEFQLIQLQAPNRFLRNSDYQTDYQFYNESEFVKLFPNQPYGEENNPETWKKGKTVFQTNFDTNATNEVSISNSNKIPEGYYLVVLSTDENGQKVENNQLVYVKNNQLREAKHQVFSYELNQTKFEPNDLAKVQLQSNVKDLTVRVRLEADNKIIKDEYVVLNNGIKSFDFKVDKSFKGNAFVHYQYVIYNSVAQGTIEINVPFDDKKLEITTSTLRDKLTPGAKEKWQFTVKGKQKDQFLAEFLASMYDASLDQFAANSFDYFPYYFQNYVSFGFDGRDIAFAKENSNKIISEAKYPNYGYNYSAIPLNSFDFSFRKDVYLVGGISLRNKNAVSKNAAPTAEQALTGRVAGLQIEGSEGINLDEATVVSSYETVQAKHVLPQPKESTNLDEVQARKALQETAFFYPNLKTDQDGNVQFEFTVPESLTEWKLMTFAHTKDMKSGYYETKVKTQKDLMVVPNLPRFLREGDQIKIAAKIVNLSNSNLSGNVKLVLFDAITNQSLDEQFANHQNIKPFMTSKNVSSEVNWTISVPKNVQAVTYRIVASAGNYSDGEESVLPVVTNRMLVTETLPIYIRENQEKTFKFDKLISEKSNTLENFKYTFEMTTNPIWYAIFSLPYLREYPYECAEQVFSRFYGNVISENVISSNPKIKAVFDDWNRKGELKSKLEVNQELKNILLEETPWVRNAVSEEEQMKRIAVLFDLNRMQSEMQSAYNKLENKQLSSGGFAWFDGGRENEYITTHIVAGFGNLKKMGIDFSKFDLSVDDLIEKAVNYLDQEQLHYYKEQKRLKNNNLDWNNGIHYLYARSFFIDQYPMPKELNDLKAIYLKNINKSKLDFSLQTQAMAALVLNRFDLTSDAKKLVKSIKEHSVDSDEMGMYWKNNQAGWFWYQAPVETQALLIEAFDEVTKDEQAVESMKVWLLKNRQTNQWNSTKATTKAVYALMNTGKSWIDAEKGIEIKVGNLPIDLTTKSAQSGSGYVKTSWDKTEIKPEMGTIEVKKTSPGVAWGAAYWQYFEDLDKISSANTSIKFNKKLYLKQNTANGPTLKEINSKTPLKVGDLVTVRLEISIDRDMQFVHIKDMRAAGFEPVNTISGYKWSNEFGYYESTRDLATNFFADYMRKGTYVFEYDLRANNSGNFSNGITSMQNMYAPELSAHSEGIRVDIQ